jgi:hypothetical protein
VYSACLDPDWDLMKLAFASLPRQPTSGPHPSHPTSGTASSGLTTSGPTTSGTASSGLTSSVTSEHSRPKNVNFGINQINEIQLEVISRFAKTPYGHPFSGPADRLGQEWRLCRAYNMDGLFKALKHHLCLVLYLTHFGRLWGVKMKGNMKLKRMMPHLKNKNLQTT